MHTSSIINQKLIMQRFFSYLEEINSTLYVVENERVLSFFLWFKCVKKRTCKMLIKMSKMSNLKLKQLKVFMKVHGIAREDFRLSALESAHTCRLYFQRIFFNKTYAAFCLTHFRLDYNLLTYICFGLCVSKAAKIVTYSAYFNIMQKVKKLRQMKFFR